VVRALVHGEKAQTQCLTVDQVFAEEIKGTNPKQESWATPNTMDCLPSRSYEAMKQQATNGGRKNRSKPGNLREQIDPLMCQAYKDAQAEANWPTPTALNRVRDEETMEKCLKFRQGNGQTSVPLYLEEKVNLEEKSWATPQSRDAKGAEGRMIRVGQSTDLPSQTEVAPTGQWNRANGKLNPRWVETLMGLPVGWTMPSCASPVTIVPTNYDCSETESSLQQQREHSEF